MNTLVQIIRGRKLRLRCVCALLWLPRAEPTNNIRLGCRIGKKNFIIDKKKKSYKITMKNDVE